MGQAIQNNINQLIGTATIGAGLYAQSPVGKRMAELRQLNLQEKAISSQTKALVKRAEEESYNGQPLTETEKEILLKGGESKESIQKRRFELQPTPENLSALEESQRQLSIGRKMFSPSTIQTPQELAAQKAEDSMKAEQYRIKAQKELQQQLLTKDEGDK